MALTKEEREVILEKPLTQENYLYLVDRIEDAEATIDRLINALVAVVRVDPDSLAAEIADAAVNYKERI